MPKRCLTMPTRCLTKSIRCLTKSIRCLTMVMRCLAKPIRCLTKSMRCLTMVMRCLTKPIRCLTMVTRCLTKHYFISKNTPHKNKTPILSPPMHVLVPNSQNCHFAPSRPLGRFPKITNFKYAKYIILSLSAPIHIERRPRINSKTSRITSGLFYLNKQKFIVEVYFEKINIKFLTRRKLLRQPFVQRVFWKNAGHFPSPFHQLLIVL